MEQETMAFSSYSDVIRQLQVRIRLRNYLQKSIRQIDNLTKIHSTNEAICRSIIDVQGRISSTMININKQYREDLVETEKDIIEGSCIYERGSTYEFLPLMGIKKKAIMKRSADMSAAINQCHIDQKIIANNMEIFHDSIPLESDKKELLEDLNQVICEIQELIRQKQLMGVEQQTEEEAQLEYLVT